MRTISSFTLAAMRRPNAAETSPVARIPPNDSTISPIETSFAEALTRDSRENGWPSHGGNAPPPAPKPTVAASRPRSLPARRSLPEMRGSVPIPARVPASSASASAAVRLSLIDTGAGAPSRRRPTIACSANGTPWAAKDPLTRNGPMSERAAISRFISSMRSTVSPASR